MQVALLIEPKFVGDNSQAQALIFDGFVTDGKTVPMTPPARRIEWVARVSAVG
jgi:hypothetical protein